ncbi:MAG: hypothetical protein FJ290_15835 [Planctomycetes bacterium]|nr:hypothetical protein [Planctomycetota bacterium]
MPDARPNILWIRTDQQRWDTVGALGNPHIRTPHVDRLLAALEASGQRDDTIVIFTSDHGEMLGDHGQPRVGYY